ncbi:MAG TPA: serine hydrolase domain-containing protein [Vitreimonas sp.]|uniref:serine hydrolase domain-containing protein n=1 Tax=Vitreimonas sp. TaxID=3069702 RepID=UPI002D7106D9|nr:serine hydrolase domain-containing protein [Vitreimonas sp.]HYD86933.1 serine hydrolase domain-containing protein [Vitreimonas sp.]
MPVRLIAAAIALFLAGCALADGAGENAQRRQAQDAAAPSGRSPIADVPLELRNGARVAAPSGWSIRREAAGFILAAPEGDSYVAILDGGGIGADAAVQTALGAYRPELALAAQGAARPQREGWDETRQYVIDAPAGGAHALRILALRKGQNWTVLIRDVSEIVAGRRDAQLEVIYNSLLPAGYARESFAGRTAQPLDETRIAALVEMIELARREYDIPGVALGLIQDGEIVFEGGFGVRELGAAESVDARTLFNIASNGKALTTLMLARLVDEGRFSWDTPVRQVWPEFQLGNRETTEQVLVRHLVCACTGLPRQDYEWLFEGDATYSTPASVMELLSRAEPTSAFGDTYQYSNLLAAAAGYFGGHALYPRRELGRAYDAAMQRLVFEPLGMSDTTADFGRAMAANHASGHGLDVDGRISVASQGFNYASISTRPSGNHWSNVSDMLRYVRMELARGVLPEGRRLISEANLLARYEPQVTEGLNEYYGMGLKVDRQWGVEVIHHGGSAAGYRSDMIWLPEHGVGAVILINSDTGSVLRAAFRRRLLELLFDGRETAIDMLTSYAPRLRAGAAEQRQSLGVPADADALAGLASRYRSAELGALEVRREDGRTFFDFGGWASEVASRRDGDSTTIFITISPSHDGLEFRSGEADGSRRLHLSDGERDYVFVEAP